MERSSQEKKEDSIDPHSPRDETIEKDEAVEEEREEEVHEGGPTSKEGLGGKKESMDTLEDEKRDQRRGIKRDLSIMQAEDAGEGSEMPLYQQRQTILQEARQRIKQLLRGSFPLPKDL